MKMKKVLFMILTLAMAFSMVACSGSEDSKGEEKSAVFEGEYIVDASYAKEQFESGDAILLDARGESAAKDGTIEGAITTSWQNLSNVETAEQGEYEWGLILGAEELSKRLGELGLSKDKEIILFAQGLKGWGEDGRILWTLESAGYENLKMVDGGLDALIEEGLNESKDIASLDPVEVEIEELNYDDVINTRELEESFDDYVIVDVREDDEYEGAVNYGEAQGGHLPGAIQVKFTDLFDEDGYLKSNDELSTMFEEANISKDDKVVVYCTAGIRSAYMQVVMDMLGYEDVKNYDGSYYTWAAQNEVE